MGITKKNKCSHGGEHKEVLGIYICTCCIHCQQENEKFKKSLERIRGFCEYSSFSQGIYFIKEELEELEKK